MNSLAKSIEIVDKTVEGAIEKGAEELGVKRDNLNVEVIEEPGSGFWGLLGNKQAKILASIKLGPADYAQNLVESILEKMGMEGKVEVDVHEDDLYININGNDLGVLIGRRGQTLNSLQYIVNVAIHRNFRKFDGRVTLDVANYRNEREKSLKQLAYNVASKVEASDQKIELEAMTPQERRIIHLALKDETKISTYSSGEEPQRRVVVAPRHD